MKWIHEHSDWPNMDFDMHIIEPIINRLNIKQAKIESVLSFAGLEDKQELEVEAITREIVASSKIESINLDTDEVRSSIKRRLGVGQITSKKNRYIEAYVEIVLAAVKANNKMLDKEMLCKWHYCLFPNSLDDYGNEIVSGDYRNDKEGIMTVSSSDSGKERIHYIAPPAKNLENEMNLFLNWFNNTTKEPFVKSAIAHYWFLVIHPFDDGNGRLGRVIADYSLANGNNSEFRYFSMSEQIESNRKEYYDILEETSKSRDLNITDYMKWYLLQAEIAMERMRNNLDNIIVKTQFWNNNISTKLNERQKAVINLVFENKLSGKLNTERYSNMFKVSKETASLDLRDLEKKNILSKSDSGGRSTSYFITALGERDEKDINVKRNNEWKSLT